MEMLTAAMPPAPKPVGLVLTGGSGVEVTDCWLALVWLVDMSWLVVDGRDELVDDVVTLVIVLLVVVIKEDRVEETRSEDTLN
jgi:hypothetical protein